MNNLDDILRNPRAHRAEVSSDQVQAWNDKALLRWHAEQEQSRVRKSRASRAVFATILYWGSLTSAAIMLGSLLWDHLEIPIDRLREMPSTLLTEMAGHPLWLAAIVVSLAVWFTRPLREILLD